MSNERDYVLGTHDEEIQRLGLQHRVWKSRVLDAWTEVGVTEGSRVLDVGCGPGYASLDLAEIVGPQGLVLGVERSTRFLDFARRECQGRGFDQVRFLEADLNGDVNFGGEFDVVWCRWVASFVPSISRLLRHAHQALKSGGTLVFHEYVQYATWQTIPKSPLVAEFVAEVMASWRAAGGEPDIAPTLLPALPEAGFAIEEVTPILFAVSPKEYGWQWPRSFIMANLKRLVETGRAREEWAQAVRQDFLRLENTPGTYMLTPTLMQIVARRL